MDFVLKLLIAGVGFGVVAALLWVGLWTVVVPELLSVSWAGHDDWTVWVFVIVGAVGTAFSLFK